MTASVGMASTPVPATVLVHGWAGSPAVWSSVVERWTAPPPLIPVALPGSPGDSSGLPCTIDGALAAVRRVLDEIGAPVVVVGHSMGGQISLTLAVDDPRVVGEVVIDPAYGATAAEADASAAWAGRIEAIGHAAVREFFDEALGRRLPADSRRAVLADVEATDPAAIASYLRSEYLGPEAIGRADRSAELADRRRVPLLAMYSNEAAAAFERAHARADATIEVWPGRGHYLQLEEPDRFCRRLQAWLAELPATSDLAVPGT